MPLERGVLCRRLLLSTTLVLASLGMLLAPAASAAPLTTIVEYCPTQARFQHDLDTAASESPARIVVTVPFCTISLSSGLTINPGADITVQGNFLLLDAHGGTFDVLTIDDTNSPGVLRLEQTSVENGQNGINLKGKGTIELDQSRVLHNSLFGIIAGFDPMTGVLTATNTVVVQQRSSVALNGGDGIVAGQLTILNSSVAENHYRGALAATAEVRGSVIDDNGSAGLYAYASAEITDSTVRHNGGATNSSGALVDEAAKVTDSVFNDNAGAGIQIIGESTVTGSEFNGNGAAGIESGDATVINSTIGNNGKSGILVHRDADVANSTISDNNEDGIFSYGDADRVTATIVMSTISGNHDQAIDGFDDAALTANILAGTKAGAGTLCTISGTTIDNGYNLTTSGTCVLDTSKGSQIVSPLQLGLEPLEPDGPTIGAPAATERMGMVQLLPGSIALDKVPDAGPGLCLNANGGAIVGPDGNAINTDEFNTIRPQVSGCDVGAFESRQLTLGNLPIVFPVQLQTLIDLIIHLINLHPTALSPQLTTTELVGPQQQVIPFAHTFQKGDLTASNLQQLGLGQLIQQLTPGAWTLKLMQGHNPATTYGVSFTVK